MGYSYSKVDCFSKCPYKYKLHYMDGLRTYPNLDANNPLIVGQAMHLGIETDVEYALSFYESQFPFLEEEHLNEEMKLEALIPKAKRMLPTESCVFEEPLFAKGFQGYMDFRTDDWLLDIKYSNQVDTYSKSPQIHVYRYFDELLNGRKIPHIGYFFIPKVSIKQGKTEEIQDFRRRLTAELDLARPQVKEVRYSTRQVMSFFDEIKRIQKATIYPKKEGWLCDWCEYKGFCQTGSDIDIDWENSKEKSYESTKE